MDWFEEYGRDFYWLVRDGERKYLIDNDVEGIPFCDCKDFLNRHQKYAEQGILSKCKHIQRLHKELHKEKLLEQIQKNNPKQKDNEHG